MKNEIKRLQHKTPLHYSYHAKSYSVHARELCNKAINNVNCGIWCYEQAIRFLSFSYRCVLIRFRALNRFKRHVKAGKVHEQPKSVITWNEYKEKYHL